jgi:hypothetical protein
MVFACSLILSGPGEFSEATSWEISQGIECRADIRIQLSPIKPETEEI